MTDPLLILAQWMSPSYPLGSFTYSHGLETLIEDGEVSSQGDLQDWIATVLRNGAGASDALFIAAGFQSPAAEIPALDATALAFCGSSERQLETLGQGTAFAETTMKVWGKPLKAKCFPVVFGEALAVHGIGLKTGILYYLQNITSNYSSIAIRLGLIGQDACQTVIANLQHDVENTAQRALDGNLDDLTSSAWIADMAAIGHETQTSRVFRT